MFYYRKQILILDIIVLNVTTYDFFRNNAIFKKL